MTGTPAETVASVAPAELRFPRAREFALAVGSGRIPYVRLLRCERTANVESALLELQVQTPQRPLQDIRATEAVKVSFQEADDRAPEVIPLRPDFPAVPHRNLPGGSGPPGLCLYEQPWPDVRGRWTSQRFVERIRDWLRLTAVGELHGADQPLEPYFLGSVGKLLLPPNLPEGTELWTRLLRDKPFVFHAQCVRPEGIKPPYDAIVVVRAPPALHGIIHSTPSSLGDLHRLLLPLGVNFLETLASQVQMWLADRDRWQAIKEGRLLALLQLPKQRSEGGAVEWEEEVAFLLFPTVERAAVSLGFLAVLEGKAQPLVGWSTNRLPQDPTDPVDPLAVHRRLSSARAAELSLSPGPTPRSAVAIGAGALGSQIIMALRRSGWADWGLIDSDILLPHNLTRHALDGRSMPGDKVSVLGEALHANFPDEPPPRCLRADVLAPGEHAESVSRMLAGASVLLDFTASRPVSKYLARLASVPARRAAVFMSPSGRDSIILLEDAARATRLDELDAQYLRAVASREELAGHHQSSAGAMRYSGGCADVTRVMPSGWASAHAALCAVRLSQLLGVDTASIEIRRLTDDGRVLLTKVPVSPVARVTLGGWTVTVDREVLLSIHSRREQHAPNETGGVLVGEIDTELSTMYLADAWEAPADSRGTPAGFVRGAVDQAERLNTLQAATAGLLEYVGEWHSHPPYMAPTPSNDDRRLLAWLEKARSAEGLPAVIGIAGAGREFRVVMALPGEATAVSALLPLPS